MVANMLRKKLPASEFDITIIDRDNEHHYQPGYLFIPFGVYTAKDVVKPRSDFMPPGVNFVIAELEKVDTKAKVVKTAKGDFKYDWLVISTGCRIMPDEVKGMMDGWGKNIFDFYTLEGAVALEKAMSKFEGGKLVLNIAEMPFKCPVAPIEFVFLADWYFHEKGIRDKVEITLVTPLPQAFTKPVAASVFTKVAEEKNVKIIGNFNIGEVNAKEGYIEGFDESKIEFDLLVAIPPNFGAQVMEDSGIGDEMCWVPTDKNTLKALNIENCYVVGDATNLPASKAGSVAHFESEVLVENLIGEINGEAPKPHFDGHSNCFIESGFGKALLIDFNYAQEPLPGKFPMPGIGPFDLLKETKMNHWGKLLFKWTYWNLLLKGEELPIGPEMSMAGKIPTKPPEH